MTKRIFRSIVAAVIIVLIMSFSVVTGVLYSHFSETGREQLKTELELAVSGVELSGEDYLKSVEKNNYRITWISSDGTVLFDTQADAALMDNHTEREEVREAFESGFGESSRYSDTLTEKMLYSARKMSDGTVLRLATSRDSVFALFLDVMIPMITILIIALLMSAFIAKSMAKRIVQPLNELNLENPADNDCYEELSTVLGKLSKQHRQITEQLDELRRKNNEFEQITDSMNEGLVLLDKSGCILSMNTAARKLFGTEVLSVGADFLTVDRSPRMQNTIKEVFGGKHREFRETRKGREYQFVISGIVHDGETVGAVILCFDITEAAFAERNRQEFTANVSHELKTPLQSIIGSAELLESGLVKPEDTERFVGNIKKEATGLVSLINDIIRLSELDENGEIVKEPVELYSVAEEVFDVIKNSAKQKDVELILKGESCVLNGVRRYLYEIIYNLCDNAVRYNKPGGTVTVEILRNGENIELKVIDTGLGIPVEHHARIFERFYRVDKSHSKDTGGTGLGLSIVKRAVLYHGGKITLESIPENGTIVTVVFQEDKC